MEIEDLLKRISNLLEKVSVAPSIVKMEKLDSLQLAWVVLGLVGYRGKLSLFLEEKVARKTAEIISRHLDLSFSTKCKISTPTSCCPIRVCPDLICEIADIGEVKAVKIAGLHTHIWRSVEKVNDLYAGLRSGNAQKLREVLDFLTDTSPLFPLHLHSVVPEKGLTFFYTGCCRVQIGVLPESLKQSLLKGEGPPRIYLLPQQLFEGGFNWGEIEFPVFFSYFVLKAFSNKDKRAILVGTEEQLARVKAVFQESLLGPGPDSIFPDDDISHARKDAGYRVDLLAERDVFCGTPRPLEEFADFRPFDEAGIMNIDVAPPDGDTVKKVRLSIKHSNGLLQFFEDNRLTGVLDSDFSLLSSHSNSLDSLAEFSLPGLSLPPASFVFYAPTFGVTFLGTSHGFDPHGRTTGFILWVNGNGVLVDPPYDTTSYLRSCGIKSHFCNKVILTHCHSDHDSGVLRKMLEGDKMVLYTTKTIHESYKRKAKAIVGRDISPYYEFHPVRIGEPEDINGASFEFEYSLHSIPTIGFHAHFREHSISYSSDTKYDPPLFSELVKRGREAALRMRGFDADLVIHEMGVPPIHTGGDSILEYVLTRQPCDIELPLCAHTAASELNNLPSSIKRRLLVVHTDGVPQYAEDSQGRKVRIEGLRIPKTGLEHTVSVKVGAYEEGYNRAVRRLQMACDCFYLRMLNPVELFGIFSSMTATTVAPGEVIFHQGEESDCFFIVEDGKVEVLEGSVSDKPVAILQNGDYFGESALWGEEFVRRRTASVVSLTETTLLSITASRFHELLSSDTDLDSDLIKVARYRGFVQTSLAYSSIFGHLSLDQIEILSASIRQELSFQENERIVEQGKVERTMFIVKEGSVRVERTYFQERKVMRRLTRGSCFGEIGLVLGIPRTASVIANEPTVVLQLDGDVFEKEILTKYPSIRFAVTELVTRRLDDNNRIDSYK